MSDRSRHFLLLACMAALLAGCGQKGPLYLPERTGEVVTRPAQTPPPADGQAPNTPQTIDSPQGSDNPAPEVTKPEDAEKKKQDGNSQPR